MSQRLGNHALGTNQGPLFLGRDIAREKDYSEETAKIVDEEVKLIVDECYTRAKELIKENVDKIHLLAEALSEKEVLDADEVKKIIGFKNSSTSDKD